MTRKANILSFDDAKSKSRRSASASSDARTARRGVRVADFASEPEPETTAEARASRRPRESASEKRKRERAKAKAGKMFEKQFASKSASDAVQEENAPRAALYEGKMGAKHRKSARMQRSSAAGSASAKVNPAGWLASIPFTARSLKVGTAVVCVLLTGLFLYAPAQQYYQAQRELDRLSEEYSLVADRNETLDVQNDILASDAGMEDAVRQKYGYVKTGEQVAVVSGLSDEATDTSNDGGDVEGSVLTGSARAPEEWYTPLLDAFFGVE